MWLSSACDPVRLVHAGGIGSNRSGSGGGGSVPARPGHQEWARPVWNWWEACECQNNYSEQTEVLQIQLALWLLGLFKHSMFASQLLVKNLQFEDGKMIPASKYFSAGESSSVELTDDEKKMAEEIRASEPSADR